MEPRWAFYYDGDCGMCRRIIAVLSSLDVHRSITWVPFQSLDDPPGGLSWDDLDRSAYFDRGKPPLLAGFHAFKALTLRLPLLWPLAPIFCLPGIARPGEIIYRWIADHRHEISRCKLPAIGGTHDDR